MVGPDVKIGDRTELKSHVVIEGNTSIGSDNVLYPFSSLGGNPQDLKFAGEAGELFIGDKNQIREYVTIHIGTKTGQMKTVVGDENLLMGCTHVAHDCNIGSRNVFANSCALAGHVSIANNVIVGGLAGIHQFVNVGDFTMIGAGAMVAKDVPPFVLAQGDRAKLRGINLIGLKRNGFSSDDVSAIKKAYTIAFKSAGNIRDKLASIPEEVTSNPHGERFVAFIKAALESNRGLTIVEKSATDRPAD